MHENVSERELSDLESRLHFAERERQPVVVPRDVLRNLLAEVREARQRRVHEDATGQARLA